MKKVSFNALKLFFFSNRASCNFLTIVHWLTIILFLEPLGPRDPYGRDQYYERRSDPYMDRREYSRDRELYRDKPPPEYERERFERERYPPRERDDR